MSANCCSASLFYPSLGPEEAGEGWTLSFILHALLGMPLLFLMGRAAPATTVAMRPGQIWPARDLFSGSVHGHKATGLAEPNVSGKVWRCSLMLGFLLVTALFLSPNILHKDVQCSPRTCSVVWYLTSSTIHSSARCISSYFYSGPFDAASYVALGGPEPPHTVGSHLSLLKHHSHLHQLVVHHHCLPAPSTPPTPLETLPSSTLWFSLPHGVYSLLSYPCVEVQA